MLSEGATLKLKQGLNSAALQELRLGSFEFWLIQVCEEDVMLGKKSKP